MPSIELPEASAASPETAAKPKPRFCENCGQPLYGEHCYSCGQPTKGLVRHFSSIIGDFFDTVFNLDARVIRTIKPLLTKPGFLSNEYFAGRRVHYVTPMRLYLFMSLIAFFVIQASVDFNVSQDAEPSAVVNDDTFANARTEAEVKAIVAEANVKLDRARKQAARSPGALAHIDLEKDRLRDRAERQSDYLNEIKRAKEKGLPPPESPEKKGGVIKFPVNGKDWDPITNPVSFAWLPAAANHSLNKRIAHAIEVMQSSDSEKPLRDALFSVLPQTLFVLLPLFALMLKVAYLFKRRLYMEHLIVALHSHSFMAMNVTLMIVLSALQEWLVPGEGFINGILGLVIGLLGVWIPIYLLLMQKRVYRQRWPMTLIKFGVIGMAYAVLLGIGLACAALIGLLTL